MNGYAPIYTMIVAAFFGSLAYVMHIFRTRRETLDRLTPAQEAVNGGSRERIASIRPIISRYSEAAWLSGLALAIILFFVFKVTLLFAAGFGLTLALVLVEIEEWNYERRLQRLEMQLADAIDLMVAGLRAGSSLPSTLQNITRELRDPLRGAFEDMLGRIRLGEEPQTALQGLLARLPLDSVRLFTTALSVHWSLGGNITSTLASLGRSVRDRIEVTRRYSAMTAQARASTVAVLLVSYLIAYVMWSHDRLRFEAFFRTEVGQHLALLVIVLQAVGVYWQSRMSKIKF
ncbi:MAG: type II secretion system F family protein [Candidatus Sumerlaeia bacterium]|nr:type II secretion system F family protein [Candidatus Sumerlaeia bacterium]